MSIALHKTEVEPVALTLTILPPCQKKQKPGCDAGCAHSQLVYWGVMRFPGGIPAD